MISYTDDKYTSFWKQKKNSQKQLKEAIVHLVKDVFDIEIKAPSRVIVHYWDCGVGYWNKGINSEVISKFLINPLPNTYICGENYSMNQSWVEGALESSNECVNRFLL
jgi:hypothetical protein